MAEKKGKLSFRNLLYNNKFMLPFSIVVSVIFWLVINISENPTREQTISDIPINISTSGTMVEDLGLDIISGGFGEKASVRVSGPSYVVSSLKPSDITVYAVLDQVNAAGTYNLKLQAVKNSSFANYNILGITPESISVTFDNVDTKSFMVTPKAIGAVAQAGLIAQTPVVTHAENETVDITGPRTEIQKIAMVVAEAQVNKTLSETESFDAVIKLFDQDGNEISTDPFTIPKTTIKISVPIFKSKELPIRAEFTNVPDFFKSSPIPHTLSENVTTVIGPPNIIDSLTEITLSPIDFYNISLEKHSFDCRLNLPTAVKSYENVDYVTVVIDVANLRERTFTVTRFSPYNYNPNLNITVTKALKNVKLCGPAASIQTLSDEDLIAEIDMSGKQAGEYSVTVKITARNHPDVWQIGTYSVIVKATEN
ncbi:MAG TPA: hypothetical protein GXX17_04850 [Clostridiales bacterium]|nr:hypothetical protein [Clostridiales bacterium]